MRPWRERARAAGPAPQAARRPRPPAAALQAGAARPRALRAARGAVCGWGGARSLLRPVPPAAPPHLSASILAHRALPAHCEAAARGGRGRLGWAGGGGRACCQAPGGGAGANRAAEARAGRGEDGRVVGGCAATLKLRQRCCAACASQAPPTARLRARPPLLKASQSRFRPARRCRQAVRTSGQWWGRAGGTAVAAAAHTRLPAPACRSSPPQIVQCDARLNAAGLPWLGASWHDRQQLTALSSGGEAPPSPCWSTRAAPGAAPGAPGWHFSGSPPWAPAFEPCGRSWPSQMVDGCSVGGVAGTRYSNPPTVAHLACLPWAGAGRERVAQRRGGRAPVRWPRRGPNKRQARTAGAAGGGTRCRGAAGVARRPRTRLAQLPR